MFSSLQEICFAVNFHFYNYLLYFFSLIQLAVECLQKETNLRSVFQSIY